MFWQIELLEPDFFRNCSKTLFSVFQSDYQLITRTMMPHLRFSEHTWRSLKLMKDFKPSHYEAEPSFYTIRNNANVLTKLTLQVFVC